jgi:hypothetical protein
VFILSTGEMMDQEDKKIWEYLQQNDFVAKNLFFYYINDNDLDGVFFDDSCKYGSNEKQFLDTTWLYYLHFEDSYFIAIGIDNDSSAVGIDNEGQFRVISGIFCNLPYDLLRLGLYRMVNQSVSEYFQKNPNFKKALDIYENWAKSEGIVLDKWHEYHDEQGELFKDLSFFENK